MLVEGLADANGQIEKLKVTERLESYKITKNTAESLEVAAAKRQVCRARHLW